MVIELLANSRSSPLLRVIRSGALVHIKNWLSAAHDTGKTNLVLSILKVRCILLHRQLAVTQTVTLG
jgi:hypothetical protein